MSTILAYDNPSTEAYRNLASQAHRNQLTLGTPFAFYVRDDFSKLSVEAEEFFRERIQGSPLVDVGCGPQVLMYELAERFGASEYIGIDIRGENRIPVEGRKPALWRIKGDMLETVARLERNSANFVINGIDGSILGTDERLPATEEYAAALVSEIAQVTKQHGLVFGLNFWPIAPRLKEDCGFRDLDPAKLSLFGSMYDVLEKSQ